MRLWGGTRSWPNLFETSESVSSQFVCRLVWILYDCCQLPLWKKKKKNGFEPESVLFCCFAGKVLLEGTWCTGLAGLSRQEETRENRSTEASVFAALTPAELHSGVEVKKKKKNNKKTNLLLPHSHTSPARHTHTCTHTLTRFHLTRTHAISQLTYCSQTNTMHYLPRSCSSLPHNRAHASSS